MKVKMKYVLLTTTVFMIIALIIFLPRLNQETSEHTSTVNEHIVETRSFEISADSTGLHTSAKGAVFIKADDGTPTYAQIVATIEIDPQDWGGVAFYTPNGWLISNITHSYPEAKREYKNCLILLRYGRQRIKNGTR